MEKDNKSHSKMSSEISTTTTTKDYIDAKAIARIETIVETLKDSTHAKQFVEESWKLDEDGNKVAGTQVVTFNKADMIMCLGLGEELGLTPWEALSYGKRLNVQVIKKINKGKSLGLDFDTSMAQIYIWGEGAKEIIYTSIHVVNACLTKAGVIREIIQDATIPKNKCIVYATGNIEDFNNVIHTTLPLGMDDITLAKVANGLIANDKIPVTRIPTYYEAEVKLTRYNRNAQKEEVIISKYTTQQAIDAGRLRGIDSWGNKVDGKQNWNADPATHTIKMCIMNGGRIIGSDILMGIYLADEIVQIKNNKSNERDTFEDAEIIPN